MRLGGQLTVSEVAVTEPAPVIALRTALSFANLERVPRPDLGGWDALLWAIPALLLLAAVLAWNATRATAEDGHHGSVIAWGRLLGRDRRRAAARAPASCGRAITRCSPAVAYGWPWARCSRHGRASPRASSSRSR
jgi:hypothetical protein